MFSTYVYVRAYHGIPTNGVFMNIVICQSLLGVGKRANKYRLVLGQQREYDYRLTDGIEMTWNLDNILFESVVSAP